MLAASTKRSYQHPMEDTMAAHRDSAAPEPRGDDALGSTR
jgi:hypothetical protein